MMKASNKDNKMLASTTLAVHSQPCCWNSAEFSTMATAVAAPGGCSERVRCMTSTAKPTAQAAPQPDLELTGCTPNQPRRKAGYPPAAAMAAPSGCGERRITGQQQQPLMQAGSVDSPLPARSAAPTPAAGCLQAQRQHCGISRQEEWHRNPA